MEDDSYDNNNNDVNDFQINNCINMIQNYNSNYFYSNNNANNIYNIYNLGLMKKRKKNKRKKKKKQNEEINFELSNFDDNIKKFMLLYNQIKIPIESLKFVDELKN